MLVGGGGGGGGISEGVPVVDAVAVWGPCGDMRVVKAC